ncbi:hypothetical protein [Pseudoalteromonas arctica]|uniref:hypothetical protein n=1 Tax=Pseudoalteromonas arctica TaxID=394751 RepID=UPI001B7D4BAC|nr:hypothetical protein [Pseudoalteromonas arctica]
MSQQNQLNTTQRVLKHVLLWSVFGYCYHSAINLLVKMAMDAQPEHILVTALLYCLGFNLLVGHLITKYDKYWPEIAAIFIACIGLLVVPVLLVGTQAILSRPLLAGILISLPILTFAVRLIKRKLTKN